MLGEWIIDTLQEWVLSRGYLTTGFVNRGDPADPDFDTGDFVKTGQWFDLDLSGIVPVGTKAVAVFAKIFALEVFKSLELKCKGQVHEDSLFILRTQVAAVRIDSDGIIPVDADRKIQYLVMPATWAEIRLTVKGWWL